MKFPWSKKQPERFHFVIGASIHGTDMNLLYEYIPEYQYSCGDVDDLVQFYYTIHNPQEHYGEPFSFLDLYNEMQVSRI